MPTHERTYEVRYGPSRPRSPLDPWPNNLELGGSGRAQVTPAGVTLTDARNALPEERRTFAMADIANVGVNADERIVVLRTRGDDREVYLWMASDEDMRAFVEALPKTTTPEFVERERQHREFREKLRAVAPKAPVTPAIIGINLAVFALLVIAGAGLVYTDGRVELRFGSDYGPLTWNGEPWRLLTAAFIHFGIIHLAFNMYALHNGGVLTERLYGSARFAIIYLLAALAGNVVSGWWDPSRNSAGASGAVFGVYGALLVFFWRRPHDLPRDLLKSVRSGALSLCVYSLAMGAVVPFIDNAAHVGGLLGGAFAGLLLVRPFEAEARATPRPGRVLAAVAGVSVLLAVIGVLAWARVTGGNS